MFARLAVVVAALLAAGCNGCPPGGTSGQTVKETPQFRQLQLPDPTASNAWASYSNSGGPLEVLPTRGRGVRLLFEAPAGEVFAVSLRPLDNTAPAVLSQNSGTPAPPEAGYFQIVDENVNANPALYTMYVRAPEALADPANFDVLVVNQSLRTDVADSAPMVVPLRQRKIFTVTVEVVGNGRVVSTPPGITCGVVSGGQSCSYVFGPGTVTLAANSADIDTTRFKEWAGNCPAGSQTCTLTLDGTAAQGVKAMFVPRENTEPVSSCPPAPLIPGLRWIDLPQCPADSVRDCDAQGHFCCETSSATTTDPGLRCGGKPVGDVDCMHRSPNGMLRQPGGCYEIAAFP